MKIYEGNSKAWDFLFVGLAYIPCGLFRQCDENAYDVWKDLIDKYKVPYEKHESWNDVTNRWNNFNIKYNSLDPYIWFNELYNLNLNCKKIKAKYEKYKDELRAHVFDVLPEE